MDHDYPHLTFETDSEVTLVQIISHVKKHLLQFRKSPVKVDFNFNSVSDQDLKQLQTLQKECL